MSTAPDTKKFLDALRWEHVALVFIICATIFSLVAWGGQKLDTISTFIIAVAGVGGYVALRQVKQNSDEVKVLANGNLARKDLEIAVLQKQLQDAQRLHTQEMVQMAVRMPSTTHLPQSLYADEHAHSADATSSTLQLPVVTG